jgi:hypothetical protein
LSKKLRLAVNTEDALAECRAAAQGHAHRVNRVTSVGIRKGYLACRHQPARPPDLRHGPRNHAPGGSILGTNNRGNPLAIRVVENGHERY